MCPISYPILVTIKRFRQVLARLERISPLGENAEIRFWRSDRVGEAPLDVCDKASADTVPDCAFVSPDPRAKGHVSLMLRVNERVKPAKDSPDPWYDGNLLDPAFGETI